MNQEWLIIIFYLSTWVMKSLGTYNVGARLGKETQGGGYNPNKNG